MRTPAWLRHAAVLLALLPACATLAADAMKPAKRGARYYSLEERAIREMARRTSLKEDEVRGYVPDKCFGSLGARVCASYLFIKADLVTLDTFDRLYRQMRTDAARARLARMQATWAELRDQTCMYEHGGGESYSYCRETFAKARTWQLRKYMTCVDFGCPAFAQDGQADGGGRDEAP